MGGDLADVRTWAGELSAVHERFVHRFNREEPRQSALAYMRGLIAPLERKNGWTLAEEAGQAGPDRIERLLNRIEWDADEVLADVREYFGDRLRDEGVHGQGDGPPGDRREGPVRLGDRGCRLRLFQGLAIRARAGGRLPCHGHHPARHRRHPLRPRPPRPRVVPRPAAAEVEAPFLRAGSPRPAHLRLGPRRSAAL